MPPENRLGVPFETHGNVMPFRICPRNESLSQTEISRDKQLVLIDNMLQRGVFEPYSATVISRFGPGMPFMPVVLVGSELVDIYNDGRLINIWFVQHHLAVPDDPDPSPFYQVVQDASESEIPDHYSRYNIPTPSLERLYEELYSRKNGESFGLGGKRERIAVLKLSWSVYDRRGLNEISQNYLGPNDFDMDLILGKFKSFEDKDGIAKKGRDEMLRSYEEEIKQMKERRRVKKVTREGEEITIPLAAD